MSNTVGMVNGYTVLREVSPNGKLRIRGYYIDQMTEKKRSCTVSLNSDSRADMRKALKKLEAKISEKTKEVSLENPKMTLEELSEKYAVFLATASGFQPSTIKRNTIAAKTISGILGRDTLVKRLPYVHVREILAQTGEEPGRLNERVKRMKTFMKWARNEGYIEGIEWMNRIGRFKTAESHREKISEKFLSQWEYIKVRDSMELEHHRLFFEFLCLTGCRPGEGIALRICDIDVVHHEIHIDHSFDCQARTLTPTKNFNSKRTIDIQDELLELLKRIEKYYALRDGKVKSQFLFHRADGTPICEPTFNKYMKNTCRQAIGRALTAHGCRHTHTSLLAAQGYDLEFISRRLGHIDSEITRRVYLHVTDELRKSDKERIKHFRLG